MADSRFVYVTYIRATPEKVWEALTGADFIRQYFFGVTFDTDWKTGSPWRMVHADGRVTDAGEVVDFTPPSRLALTWRNEFMPELTEEGFTHFLAEIEAAGEATKLSITHSAEVADSKTIQAVSGGWPRILSNLKSLLETGEVVIPSK
ncbi:MAG: SRPBCC family protein [Asticcacaulis sp.]